MAIKNNKKLLCFGKAVDNLDKWAQVFVAPKAHKVKGKIEMFSMTMEGQFIDFPHYYNLYPRPPPISKQFMS